MSNQPPKAPFKPQVAASTPNPAVQPARTAPQRPEDVERAAHVKTQQALTHAHAERIKAEAESRDREHKSIHRHGVWRGRTEGVIVGIPLGVLVVFLAAMSLQDRFSQERWSGAREAVSSEYRAGVIQPPPASVAKP